MVQHSWLICLILSSSRLKGKRCAPPKREMGKGHKWAIYEWLNKEACIPKWDISFTHQTGRDERCNLTSSPWESGQQGRTPEGNLTKYQKPYMRISFDLINPTHRNSFCKDIWMRILSNSPIGDNLLHCLCVNYHEIKGNTLKVQEQGAGWLDVIQADRKPHSYRKAGW